MIRRRAPGKIRRTGPERRRWLLASGAVVLAALAAGGLLLFDHLHGPAVTGNTTLPPTAPDTSASPSSDGFTAQYTGTELTAPDHGYAFELKEGKVVPENAAKWALSLGDGEFYIPVDADAFLADDDGLTPADCVKGVDSRPVTELPYTEAREGRSFCVRQRSTGEVAIVRLLTVSQGDGPVKVSVDFYEPAN